jgi:hypothetical protein
MIAHVPRQPRSSRRRLLLAAGASALPALATARPLAARQSDAAGLLRQSATVMADLQSFHFELSTPQGQTKVLDALELVRVEGDVLRPDRYRATVAAKAAVLDVSLEVIGVGDQLWVSDPTGAAGGGFVEIPMDPATSSQERLALANLLNPDALWLAALGLVTEPAVIGENAIDGEPVTRIDALLDLGRIAAFAPPDANEAAVAAELPTLPVSLWLTGTGHLRRLEAEGAILPAEAVDVVRRLDLTRFDEPVTIEPPPA